MLTALPIFTFVTLFTVHPGFYLDVAADPIMIIGFPSLVILYFIGVIIIRKIIDIKV
jgi:tight adherence protein B